MDQALAWTIVGCAISLAALAATVIFGLPPFVEFFENRRVPSFTASYNVDLERPPRDRLQVWSRSRGVRYVLIKIKNRRGKPLDFTAADLTTSLKDYPHIFIPSNKPITLEAHEPTHFFVPMEELGDPARATLLLAWRGGEQLHQFPPA